MTEVEKLAQLKEMLSSHLIGKRKAGIMMAVEMLTNDVSKMEVRAILENISKNDLIMQVQEDAQKALDDDDARYAPPKSPDYIFGARCPKRHVSYYDKREYCPKNSNITRRTILRDPGNIDELLVQCKTAGCNEKFYVEIDCEGYK